MNLRIPAVITIMTAMMVVVQSGEPPASLASSAELVTPTVTQVVAEEWSFPVVISGGAGHDGTPYRRELRLLPPEPLDLQPPLGPFGITLDGDTLWVGLFDAGRLLQLDLAAETAAAYVLPQGMTPFLLTPDPHGGIWFTDFDYSPAPGPGQLAHLDPHDRVLTTYPVPLEDAGPAALAFAPDGRLWFSAFRGGAVGELDLRQRTPGQQLAAAEITLHPIPASQETVLLGALGLVVDQASGSIWYAEAFAPRIYRLDPDSGEHHPLDLPEGFRSIVGLTQAPDGNLWTGQHGGDRLLEMTPAGDVARVLTSAAPPPEMHAVSAINDLVVGPDGHLWFSQHFVNRIGRLDRTTGTVMEYEVGRQPLIQWLVRAQDGVWFAAHGEDSLVHLNARQAPLLEVQLAQVPSQMAAGEVMTFEVHATWQAEAPPGVDLQALVQPPFGVSLTGHEAAEPPPDVDAAFLIQLAVADTARPRTVSFPAGVSSDDFVATTTVEVVLVEAPAPAADEAGAWLLPVMLALALAAAAVLSFVLARRLLGDAP